MDGSPIQDEDHEHHDENEAHQRLAAVLHDEAVRAAQEEQFISEMRNYPSHTTKFLVS